MRQETRRTITTTLYDLISALHTHVGVEDDQVITTIVTYLLRTGQIRFIEKWPTDHGWITHREDWHLNDSFVFPSRRKSQPTSSINPWEKTGVGAGLAKGACDVRA